MPVDHTRDFQIPYIVLTRSGELDSILLYDPHQESVHPTDRYEHQVGSITLPGPGVHESTPVNNFCGFQIPCITLTQPGDQHSVLLYDPNQESALLVEVNSEQSPSLNGPTDLCSVDACERREHALRPDLDQQRFYYQHSHDKVANSDDIVGDIEPLIKRSPTLRSIPIKTRSNKRSWFTSIFCRLRYWWSQM